MGQKNLKGSVSVVEDNKRIRLRWRYLKKRYSLNLFLYNKANLLQAKKIALQIESDLVNGLFDSSLNKYKGKEVATCQTLESSPVISVNTIKSTGQSEVLPFFGPRYVGDFGVVLRLLVC